jgi:hydrogenase maturation protease
MKSLVTESAQVLVLGYGNPLRGDDGVGPEVIRRLTSDPSDPRISFKACRQLTPELSEEISRFSTVIFIDASVEQPAGEIACREIAGEASAPAVINHSMKPQALLAMTQQLYDRCPRAYVLSVGGDDFGVHPGLSHAVATAVPQLVERLKELVSHA